VLGHLLAPRRGLRPGFGARGIGTLRTITPRRPVAPLVSPRVAAAARAIAPIVARRGSRFASAGALATPGLSRSTSLDSRSAVLASASAVASASGSAVTSSSGAVAAIRSAVIRLADRSSRARNHAHAIGPGAESQESARTLLEHRDHHLRTRQPEIAQTFANGVIQRLTLEHRIISPHDVPRCAGGRREREMPPGVRVREEQPSSAPRLDPDLCPE
jgi:hypothetical protein